MIDLGFDQKYCCGNAALYCRVRGRCDDAMMRCFAMLLGSFVVNIIIHYAYRVTQHHTPSCIIFFVILGNDLFNVDDGAVVLILAGEAGSTSWRFPQLADPFSSHSFGRVVFDPHVSHYENNFSGRGNWQRTDLLFRRMERRRRRRRDAPKNGGPSSV